MNTEDSASDSIGVLVVDDSRTIRRLLERAIERDRRLRVAGLAADGEQCLNMLSVLQPDVIVLDVAMPGMSGLEVLDRIRESDPDLPVVIFSSLLEPGSKIAFEAILRGATYHLRKPDGETLDQFNALLQKLVSVVETKHQLARMRPPSQTVPVPQSKRQPRLPELVVVGSSTGGPNALAAVIDRLPADLSVPIVIVQHMPPVLTRYLAKRLDTRTPLTVFEASHGDLIRPGTLAIAPGDHHLEVSRAVDGLRAVLNDAPPENSCRPAVDVLFRTAARLYGPGVLGVVLTGMGQDGLQGARAIREEGGRVLVQDQESSVVWGMPRVVAEAGLANEVVPITEMANRIWSFISASVS